MFICIGYKPGLVEYSNACKLQKNLHKKRVEGKISDVLLLLEHPPIFTIGKSGRLNNLLVSVNQLRQKQIGLFSVERGGDVTYHGPGQLVVYPIICLKQRGKDVHQYVHNLEEVVLRTLKDFGIDAARDDSHAGVWVNNEEIAAIGISVRRWVTMHGFALNVDVNLKHFSLINFCGFSDRRVTSMTKLLGHAVSIEAVFRRVTAHFSDVFDTVIIPGSSNDIKKYL